MTVTPDHPHAPGCFGSALCFQAESPECGSCQFATACAPTAEARTAELRERLGLKIKQPKAKPKKATPVVEGAARTLPVKVEDLLQRIERAGIRVTESLRAGVNPFASKPMFLRLTCHLLLRMPNGFTRQELQQAMQTKLEWSPATANAHATQACQALIALGAAKELNGRLVRTQ